MTNKPAWVKLWGGLGEAAWRDMQINELAEVQQDEITSTEIINDLAARHKTMDTDLFMVNLKILVLLVQREQMANDHKLYMGAIKE